MEETAACHFRQVFVVRDDVDADILKHTANIYIISDLYNIIHKKCGSLPPHDTVLPQNDFINVF